MAAYKLLIKLIVYGNLIISMASALHLGHTLHSHTARDLLRPLVPNFPTELMCLRRSIRCICQFRRTECEPMGL